MCTRVNGYDDLLADAQVDSQGIFTWANQLDTGPIPVPNLPGMAPLTPDDPRGHSPRIGQHSRDVLTELGYAADEIARLARDSVIAGDDAQAAAD